MGDEQNFKREEGVSKKRIKNKGGTGQLHPLCNATLNLIINITRGTTFSILINKGLKIVPNHVSILSFPPKFSILELPTFISRLIVK